MPYEIWQTGFLEGFFEAEPICPHLRIIIRDRISGYLTSILCSICYGIFFAMLCCAVLCYAVLCLRISFWQIHCLCPKVASQRNIFIDIIRIKNQAAWILDLYLFIFVFPIFHTVPSTRKFNTYKMDWIDSSSWVIALHPNSTNISPELLTSTKLIDLRFISSPVQPMQLIFWLTVKCFIADRTSSMKIKRKNLINIPSCYFSYHSLLVHS